MIAACSASPGAPTAAPATATPGPGATTAPTTPPAGPTNAPPTGPAVDICALLSPEELSAATGKDYLAGLPDDFGQCYWDGDQLGPQHNAGDTIVGAINVQELAFIKSAFEAGGSDVALAGQHPAFYNPTEGLGSIWVDLGNGSLLVLSVPTSGDLDPSYERILVQLALTALSKM